MSEFLTPTKMSFFVKSTLSQLPFLSSTTFNDVVWYCTATKDCYDYTRACVVVEGKIDDDPAVSVIDDMGLMEITTVPDRSWIPPSLSSLLYSLSPCLFGRPSIYEYQFIQSYTTISDEDEQGVKWYFTIELVLTVKFRDHDTHLMHMKGFLNVPQDDISSVTNLFKGIESNLVWTHIDYELSPSVQNS